MTHSYVLKVVAALCMVLLAAGVFCGAAAAADDNSADERLTVPVTGDNGIPATSVGGDIKITVHRPTTGPQIVTAFQPESKFQPAPKGQTITILPPEPKAWIVTISETFTPFPQAPKLQTIPTSHTPVRFQQTTTPVDVPAQQAKTPAPVMGILGGLGATAVLFGLRMRK